jgi:putative membrane protein
VTDDKPRRGPVILPLAEPGEGPAAAPPPPESGPLPEGRAMQAVAAVAARPPSRLARLFWAGAGGFLALVLSVAAWDFVTGLMDRVPLIGALAAALGLAALLAALLLALREALAWARLARLDRLHRAALTATDLAAARRVTAGLAGLYASRPDLAWALARLAERKDEVLDPEALLALAERELMAPLDAAARREVEAAARMVATVTAVVPLALADVAAALVANLRMIRRIAELYGGRAGTFGSWRLARTVFAHLAATGAVAVGDDLIHSVAGGGIVGKLSRRFGEGVVNGALTARVGIAAMEVCRPLPFGAGRRPSVSGTVKRALAGLFGMAG